MLHVSGSLRLTIDGQHVDLSADGGDLRAEIARPRRLLRALGKRSNVRVARRLATTLYDYRQTLVVTQRGRTIARVGAGATSGWIGKLLRIPYLRFYRR